jgi:hypothetical protein
VTLNDLLFTLFSPLSSHESPFYYKTLETINGDMTGVKLREEEPKWLQETLKEAQEFVGNPKKDVRESKVLERFCSYLAMVRNIIEFDLSTVEEATKQVSKDAIVEEYNSVIKNDVWEIVPRPEGKLVVTSRWLYKIKHAANDLIEKYKTQFVARGFS